MKLSKGITGFAHYTDPELPATDERVFHAVCHAVARSMQGEVVYIEPIAKHREKNFSVATIGIQSRNTSVLLNAHYPYLAFASALTLDNNAITFIDWHIGTTEFGLHSDYTILTTEELSTPCSEIDTSHLGIAELEQIDYWRPQTVGELIFNYWD